MKCAHDSAGAALVQVHFFNETSWLEVETTSVKGETLAHQGDIDIFAIWVAFVVHKDTSWFRLRAFTDLVKEVHTEIFELLAADDSCLCD